MAQPPRSTDGAAAPVEVHPPSIEGVFPSGEIGSVVPSVQVLATEVEAEASSAQGSAAELTSKVKHSPDKSEIKESPENTKEPSAEMEKCTEVEMTAGMVKSAEIEKHSQTQVDYSAETSSGEIDASKIKKSTAVETSTSQMENSAVENSNGKIDASKTKQSAETEKHSETETETEKLLRRERDELISGETTDFILRLDRTGTVTLMFLASPMYAVLAVLPLWLAADKPQALLWTFAHLACFYMFLWIITLSTIRISTAFFRITYIFLLACTVVHLIGPVNGLLSLYAGMIYVAGMLGYAVAEHLHLTGFEQTASALCTTQFNTKDFKERALLMCVTTVVMTTPILARMAWVVFLVPYSGHNMTRMDVLAVVVELTWEIFVVGGLWIVYMLDFFLGGAFVSMETFGVTASICSVACCSLALLLSFKIAEALGMLVLWLGWMAVGVFFGYYLGLRACYCKMLTGYLPFWDSYKLTKFAKQMLERQ